MSYTFMFDLYTINNFINAGLTIFILIGCSIWLARFFSSAIKHRDRIGVFLVAIAVLLIIGNLVSLMAQIGQALSLGEWRLVFSTIRLGERITSACLVILLFFLGKAQYE